MPSDEHLNMPLPCGIYEGKTINRVMQDNPSYLAWFVDNINKFEGRTAVIDTVVAQIKEPQPLSKGVGKVFGNEGCRKKESVADTKEIGGSANAQSEGRTGSGSLHPRFSY